MSVNIAVTHRPDTRLKKGTQSILPSAPLLVEAERLLNAFSEKLHAPNTNGRSLMDDGSITRPEIAINLEKLADDLHDLADLQAPKQSVVPDYIPNPKLQEVVKDLMEIAADNLHGLHKLPDSAAKEDAIIEILHSLASAARSAGHLAALGPTNDADC